ncbi:MAG: hypothetical protein QN162_15330 [Armatimonadota bacterium]|nr:hypothetical protein [Armatimonadota bacterium]
MPSPLGMLAPPNLVLSALTLAGLPGDVIEAALTRGQGYRAVAQRAGLPEAGPLGPAAMVAGVTRAVADPLNLVSLGLASRASRVARARQAAEAAAEAGAVAARRAPRLPLTQEVREFPEVVETVAPALKARPTPPAPPAAPEAAPAPPRIPASDGSLGGLLGRVFSRPEAHLRARAGAGGASIADRALAVERGVNQAEARIAQELRRLPRLSPAEEAELAAALENPERPIRSSAVQKWVAHYRQRLAELGRRLEQSGLHRIDVEGERLPFVARQNYLPHVPDPQAVARAMRGEEPYASALRRLAEERGLRTLREAERYLLTLRGRMLSERYAGFQHVREFHLPPELRLPPSKALPLHELAVERRLLEAQYYGPRDEFLQQALNQIAREAPEESVYARKVVAHLTRRDEPREAIAEHLANIGTSGVVLTTMGPLSTIRQGQQILNTMRITGARAILRAAPLLRTPEGRAAVQRLGVLHERALQEALGMSEQGSRAATAALRAYGFTGLDRYWRALSGLAGREFGKMLLADLQRGGRRAAVALDYFRRAGVNVAEALAKGPAAVDAALDDFGWWVARETQFGGVLTTPLWMRHPLGRVVMILRRFAYQQAAWQWQYLVREARREPLKTAQALAGFLVAGEGIQDAVALARAAVEVLASGRMPTFDDLRQELAQRPNDPVLRALDNLFAGLGGVMMVEFLKSLYKLARRPGMAKTYVLETLGGPAIGKAATAVGAAAEAVRQLSVRPLAKQLPRVLLPSPFGSALSRTLVPPTSGATRRRRR